MADVRVNLGGVREVLNSAGVKSLVKGEADKVAARANGMYSLRTRPRVEPYGSSLEPRVTGAVGRAYTKTRLGRIDNAHSNTLMKAMG